MANTTMKNNDQNTEHKTNIYLTYETAQRS